MKIFEQWFVAAVLAAAVFIETPAENPKDAGDPLPGYLELAARNNPALLQQLSEYEASLQKIPQVGSLPDPELSAGVFLSPMEQVEGRQKADFRLMQMFPWFGTLKAAKDEMSLMARAKYESLHQAKLEVFEGVERTWYELYKLSQEVRIYEKNLQILRTLERLTLVKFKTTSSGGRTSESGAGMPSDQSVSAGSQGMQSMTGVPEKNKGADFSPTPLSSQDKTM